MYSPHYREHEGVIRPWVFNTFDVKLTKDGKKIRWKANFPFWSVRTIKRTITSLKEKGLITVTDQFNERSTNRTLWYTINYDPDGTIDSYGELLTGGTVESDKMALS